jgi:excisionase family DNA binding protein
MAKDSPSPRKSESRKAKPKPRLKPKSPFGMTVEEAGKLVGLSRNSAYEAVKNKQIPVLEIGHRKIVLRKRWLEMIGADVGADDAT